MAYVTASDVTTVLGPTSAAATQPSSVMADAIAEAQAEVDGRLGERYPIPFTEPVPQPVYAVTRDIAAYLAVLTARNGDPLAPGEPIVLRYTRAQNLLNLMATGAVKLPADPGKPPIIDSGAAIVVNPYAGELFGLSAFQLVQQSSWWRPERTEYY